MLSPCFRRPPTECPPRSLRPRDQQHRLRINVPFRRLHRAHSAHFHLCGLATGWFRFVRGRLRRTDGHPTAGQTIHSRRRDIVGYWLRGTEPARRLYADKRVSRVDQYDHTVLKIIVFVLLLVK